MKTMTVGEFKAHFSEVVDDVKAGETVAVTFGKKKEIVGYFSPKNAEQKTKRTLGILEGKATVIFKDNFEMTDEEFLSL